MALAHRADDCTVNSFLPALSRSRRSCSASNPGSTGCGRETAARSVRPTLSEVRRGGPTTGRNIGVHHQGIDVCLQPGYLPVEATFALVSP
ncbi:MAG: hypothetical protein ACJ74F_35625 [Mycobacterium sp.]|uniref:hypothetical protein n=1 Tax=Mycobacterium sp. TaxID=1785 RepID=UPI00389A9B72